MCKLCEWDKINNFVFLFLYKQSMKQSDAMYNISSSHPAHLRPYYSGYCRAMIGRISLYSIFALHRYTIGIISENFGSVRSDLSSPLGDKKKKKKKKQTLSPHMDPKTLSVSGVARGVGL